VDTQLVQAVVEADVQLAHGEVQAVQAEEDEANVALGQVT